MLGKLLNKTLVTILSFIILLYQIFFRPYVGSCCRFQPSCSHYALAVLRYQGAVLGSWSIVKRLFRCNPWLPGGDDPPNKNLK